MLIILIVIEVVIFCVYLGSFSCTWMFASLHFGDFAIFSVKHLFFPLLAAFALHFSPFHAKKSYLIITIETDPIFP